MTCYYCGKADGKHIPECPKVASVDESDGCSVAFDWAGGRVTTAPLVYAELWNDVVCDKVSALDESRLAKAQRAWLAFMRPMTSR